MVRPPTITSIIFAFGRSEILFYLVKFADLDIGRFDDQRQASIPVQNEILTT